MAVVGTAEIIIVPVLKGFGNVGAKARAELGTVGTAAAGMSGQLATAEKATGGLESGLVGAGGAAAGSAGKLGEAEKGARGLAGAAGEAEKGAGRAGGALRAAERDTSTFGLGMSGAAGKVKGFALEATKLGSIIGVAGVAAAIYKGTEAANKFNAEMLKISTQAGVSTEKLDYLKTGALGLAGKIGADPDSLAESLFHVESNFASMGISSTQALSLVETAAKGAKVGGADLVDVTNALTAAVAAQIPGVDNLDEAMGYLNATVGSGDMSMQDLANAMGTGAVAVVKGYGLSIKDVGAALAVFGDNNIRGAQAGTNLRMVVQSLAVPAKGGADALTRLGLTQDTLAKDMQKGGLNAAIVDLHNRMNAAGISAQQQGQILTEAFGKKAGTGLAILVSQFDRLQSKYPELEHGAHNFGSAWDNTAKGTKQKIDQLKGSFDALLINVGNSTRGAQNKVIGAATGLVQNASLGAEGFARSMKSGDVETDGWLGGVQKAAVKLRAEGPGLEKTFSNIKKIVVELTPTFLKLGAAVGGGLLVALHGFERVVDLAANHTTALKVALLLIGGVMLANKVATLGLTAATAAGNIVRLLSTARESGFTVALGANSVAKTENLIGTRLLTAAYNSSLATVLRSGAALAWNTLKIIANTAASVAAAVASKAVQLALKAWTAAQWLLNVAMDANPIGLVVIAIVALVAGAILAYKHVGWFRDAVKAVGRALEEAGKWVVKAAKAFGHDLVDAFHWAEDAAKSVGRFFSRIYDDVKHWLGVALDFVKKWWPLMIIVMSGGLLLIPVLVAKYWRQIYEFTVRIFNDVKNFVVRIFKDVYHAVSSAVSAVIDFVRQHWRLILVIVSGIFGLLIVLIVNNWSKITGAFKAAWDAVSGFMSRMWHDVAGFFSNMWHDVAGFVSRMWSDVTGWVSRTARDVADGYMKLWRDVSSAASRIWHDVAGFFSDMWRDVSGFASRIWHDVAGFFSDLWRDVSGWVSRAWHDTADFFSRMWSDVSGFARRIWNDVAGFFSDLWRDVSGWATRTWHDVAGFFTNLWHDVAGFASNLWRDVSGWFSRVWSDVSGFAKRIWTDVTGFFSNIWHDTTTTASNLWKDVTGWFDRIKNDVTNSVKTATGWIKGAWDGLKEIFKVPINFMINTVYNDGIVPTWNFLADIVHEPHLAKAKGLQTGARLPGYGGGDIIPAMLEPGEAVIPKHLVPEISAWARQKGIPGFALGGVVGAIGAVGNAITHPLDTLEALGSGTLSVLGTAVHWVRGALAAAVQAMLVPVRAAINNTLGTKDMDWKGAAGKLMTRPLDKIVDIARGQDDKDKAAAAATTAAPVAAAPVGDIQAYAAQLLAQHGWTNQWNAFNALEMGEAGWNPAALNASSGAYGLAQALPASKYDSYGNRNDYHVQLRWMLDYIGQRYGSPANAYSTWLGRSPHWYDQGGPLKPGLTLAANGTGKDEWIVPKSAVTTTTGSGRQAGTTLTLNVDARGATDPAMVEQAVRKASADLVATLEQMLQQGVGGAS